MNSDHIVVFMQQDEVAVKIPFTVKCLRCGQVLQISMPVSVSLICGIEKTFRREHLKCQPAPGEKQEA